MNMPMTIQWEGITSVSLGPLLFKSKILSKETESLSNRWSEHEVKFHEKGQIMIT